MLSYLAKFLTSLRARWRWSRGRCPVCNRNLHAVFAYYMASHPHCFCREETHADKQFWRKYLDTLAVSENSDKPTVSVQGGQPLVAHKGDSTDQNVRAGDGTLGGSAAPEDECTELVWCEEENGRVRRVDEWLAASDASGVEPANRN